MESADQFSEAMVRGRMDELYRFATPEEISSGKLTLPRWRALFSKFVWPRIRNAEYLGRMETVASGNFKSLGATSVGFRLKDGSVHQLVLDVSETGEGPRTALVAKALTFAWKLEYLATTRTDGSLPNIRATLFGLSQDRAGLEELGIYGWYSDPVRGFRTWGTIISDGDRLVSKANE